MTAHVGQCAALCPLLWHGAEMYPQDAPDAVCGLCGPFVGSTQFRALQRRPVGAEAQLAGAPAKPSSGFVGRGGAAK